MPEFVRRIRRGRYVIIRITLLTDAMLLAAVSRTVQQAFSPSFSNFQSRWVLIVTWHNVSRYTSSTARDHVGLYHTYFKRDHDWV